MKTIINVIIEILKALFTGTPKKESEIVLNENENDFQIQNEDPVWLKIAFKELGQKEVSGSKHNERIIEYHKSTTLKAGEDEIAWCSSFVNWCINQAGIEGTGSAAARSWTNWAGKVSLSGTLKRGSIVVLKRGTKSWQGHVGFLVKYDDKHFWLLGGNQSNSVSIQKYYRHDLISIRWP